MDFPFLFQGLLFSPEQLHTHSLRKYHLLFSVIRVDADVSLRKEYRPPFPGVQKTLQPENLFRKNLFTTSFYLHSIPTVKGLIAHITVLTVLAVALTALKIDQKDTIHYVKTLIPKLFL